MVIEPNQSDLTVLITRPKQQTEQLIQQIEFQGINAICFPVIEIVAIDPGQWPKVTFADYDMMVFVSRNAVKHFFAGITGSLPNDMVFVSVGAATSASLRKRGVTVDIEAPPPAGSDSLLKLAELQNMTDKRVLIVRGVGGRELLANTLQARGAKISYLEVYQRQLPTPTNEEVDKAKQVDCIIATSNASLDNLCQLIADDELKNKSLIVVSERIRQHAIELGFQHVYVTEDVSDAAIVQQVIEVGQNNGK